MIKMAFYVFDTLEYRNEKPVILFVKTLKCDEIFLVEIKYVCDI